MYFLSKGNAKVEMPDKKSATDLIYALTIMGSTESMSVQTIVGNKEQVPVFEVCFLDKAIKVYGQYNAETVMSWMFSAGVNKVTVTKLDEKEMEDGRREEGSNGTA